MNFSSSFLLASLFWGSVGTGYFIYGKKQRSWPPMVGGIAIIAVSYPVSLASLMAVASIGMMMLT